MNLEIVSFQYATGMCLLLENVGGCEQNRSVANVNVQSDDLWPSRMHAATHILKVPEPVTVSSVVEELNKLNKRIHLLLFF